MIPASKSNNKKVLTMSSTAELSQRLGTVKLFWKVQIYGELYITVNAACKHVRSRGCMCRWWWRCWKPPLGGLAGGRPMDKEERKEALTEECVLKAALPWMPRGQVQSLPGATDACSERVRWWWERKHFSSSLCNIHQLFQTGVGGGEWRWQLCKWHVPRPGWAAGTTSSPGLALH